jgi:hypothetical protein
MTLQINEAERLMLKDFFAAYFHQDWDCDADTPRQVVDDYLRVGWPKKHLDTLSMAIRRYADSHANDAELEEKLLSELGCYYLPSADGISAREWLQMIADQLASPADNSRR